MRADSLIETNEIETQPEPDTQPDVEVRPAGEAAAVPETEELVGDTPPSSQSSVESAGPVLQPAHPSAASTAASRKREAEGEAGHEDGEGVGTGRRERSTGVADGGIGVVAMRTTDGAKRRRVGVSAPIFLCFTKRELGIADDDEEDD